MSQFSSTPGSIDVKIGEIPIGTFRVKVIGTVVNLTVTSLIINDGEHSLKTNLGQASIEKLEVGQTIRAIMDVVRKEDGIFGTLTAWNLMKPNQVEKYWRLVKIERRIPKE